MRSLALIISLFSLSSGAEGVKILNANPLTILSSTLKSEKLPQGSNSEIEIEVELAPLHHAYETQFRVIAPELNWVQLSHPKPQPMTQFFDPVSKKSKQGIQGGISKIKTVLGIKSHAPIGKHSLDLQLVYQACTKKYCLLPKKVPFTVSIDILSSESQWATTNNKASKKELQKLSWVEENLSKGFAWTLFFAFIAGILTSFTPCIFPMIPITLAVLGTRGRQRSHWAGLGLSICYVLGIAATYSTLGLVAASTGALFGSFLGHPGVALGLGVLFFILALGMFGLFEIQVPLFIQNKLGIQKGKGGPKGAFLAGIFAGILASPCVGPVLVAILAYVAKSQDLLFGFLLLFVFAIGMGQIFLVLGTFSQMANKLPKAGSWMIAIKTVMGIAMLALSIFYLRPLLPTGALSFLESENSNSASIPWREYSEENLREATELGKPVIIDFYADWCAACIEMDVKTFSSTKVQAVKDQFVWIKFDATDASTPEFEKLRKKYEIPGLPWFVFYSATGEHLKDLTLAGFESPDEFLNRLEKVMNPEE